MSEPVSRRHRVVLEVCVESAADAEVAAAGGADRLELNSALALDGLTPSVGLLEETRRRAGPRLPVVAMARPRAGGFCYSDVEFRVLLRDVDLLLEHGADGVAFGVLAADGTVDRRRCRQVVRRVEAGARGKRYEGPVFHRAFDQVKDPAGGLEQLIDLGVRRVMTSGGRATAMRGAKGIAELVRRAAGRIEVLPAGGVRPANAVQLLRRTGCGQLHTSLREAGSEGMSPELLRDMVDVLRR